MHKKYPFYCWISVCFLAVLGLLFGPARPVAAAIRLSSFTAAAASGRIDLRWETASEVGTAGFYIQRSAQQNSGYSRISSFIPVTGDGLTGSIYTYANTGLNNGSTYYYRLEALNSNQTSEFHGPVVATVGGSAAATLTPSLTPTPQPSATLAPSATTPPTPIPAVPSATTANNRPTRAASTATLRASSTPGGSSASFTPAATTPAVTNTAATTTPTAGTTSAGLPSATPALAATEQLSVAFAATPAGPTPTLPPATPTPVPAGAATSLPLPLPLLVLGGAVVVLMLGLGGWGAIHSLRGGTPK